jgi:DNA-binding transcriptional ArsR family regulator
MPAAADPVAILGMLADETRLRAFAALILGARRTSEVAERAGVLLRDAVKVLTRLEAAGLAERNGDGWQARVDLVREVVARTDGTVEAAAPEPTISNRPTRGRSGAPRVPA